MYAARLWHKCHALWHICGALVRHSATHLPRHARQYEWTNRASCPVTCIYIILRVRIHVLQGAGQTSSRMNDALQLRFGYGSSETKTCMYNLILHAPRPQNVQRGTHNTSDHGSISTGPTPGIPRIWHSLACPKHTEYPRACIYQSAPGKRTNANVTHARPPIVELLGSCSAKC